MTKFNLEGDAFLGCLHPPQSYPALHWANSSILTDEIVVDVNIYSGLWQNQEPYICHRCGGTVQYNDYVSIITVKPGKEYLVCRQCGVDVLEYLVRKDI